jgi:hypothetical protein
MAKPKTLIEYMIRRLGELGAIEIKKVVRDGIDEATVQLKEPLDVAKLNKVKHNLDLYYPDGLQGSYIKFDPLPKQGATVVFVNVH